MRPQTRAITALAVLAAAVDGVQVADICSQHSTRRGDAWAAIHPGGSDAGRFGAGKWHGHAHDNADWPPSHVASSNVYANSWRRGHLCDAAAFVRDVTIPDGSTIPAGQ